MKHIKLFENFKENILLNKPASFLVAHLIGNPVDALDTFIQLSKKQIENGNYKDALEILDNADKVIEKTKIVINDFRNKKYTD